MLRSLVLALAFCGCTSAAIWPEQLGKYQRKSAKPFTVPDRVGPDEYGRDDAEEADYGSFYVLAQRFKDSTGAYAAWLETAGRSLQVGNYLITCTGKCPKNLGALAEALPKLSRTPVPALDQYLPKKGRIPGSERYVLGPAGLHANLPQIQESAVALQFGTEGQIARYRLPGAEQTLAIFSYPTPEIARQQAPAYQAIPGAVVKRTGPLVAIAVPSNGQPAPDRAESEKLLAQINYQGSVSWNEPLPLIITPQTTAQMILGILTLAGIVLGLCFGFGLVFAVVRIIARRFGYSGAEAGFTTLHLGGK